MEVEFDGHQITVKLQENKRWLVHCHTCGYFEQFGKEYDALAFAEIHVGYEKLGMVP